MLPAELDITSDDESDLGECDELEHVRRQC
jgi:hypothetical protein